MIGQMIGACGADDVARLRLVFRKRRFQMIDDTYFGDRKIVDAIHGTTAAVYSLRGNLNLGTSSTGQQSTNNANSSASTYGGFGFGGFLQGFFGLPDSSAIPVRIVQSWGDALGFNGILGSILGFAKGGNPDPSRPFMAGEEGPEIIDPQGRNLSVFTADQTRSFRKLSASAASGGGSSNSYGGHSFSFHVHGITDPDAFSQSVARRLPIYLRTRSANFTAANH